jgi:hypothetical protein
LLIKLRHLVVNLDSDSSIIRTELAQLFTPFLCEDDQTVNIHFQIELASVKLPPPGGIPDYKQPGLMVFQNDHNTILYLPDLGQLKLDLRSNIITCLLAPTVIDTYGAFEDIIAMGLAPLLRRNGCILIHAFAAALQDRALLLVGDNASGKTTTGLTLLANGWRLMSNDSPMLGKEGSQVMAFAYPGYLSADVKALNFFPALRSSLIETGSGTRPGWKTTFPYEKNFNLPWQKQAPVHSICLLDLQAGAIHHQLEPLSPASALGRLLPHSVDSWDQSMLSLQIEILEKLIQQAPAFLLHLGPDVPALPAMLEQLAMAGNF